MMLICFLPAADHATGDWSSSISDATADAQEPGKVANMADDVESAFLQYFQDKRFSILSQISLKCQY